MTAPDRRPSNAFRLFCLLMRGPPADSREGLTQAAAPILPQFISSACEFFSMAAKTKIVTVLVGFLYDLVWRDRAEVLEMDAARADVLAAKVPPIVRIGEHELPPEDVEAESAAIVSNAPTFTPADFPGAAELAAAGVMNCDQLGELMKTGGDAWFAKVEGIGKKMAAKISEALAKLNAES